MRGFSSIKKPLQIEEVSKHIASIFQHSAAGISTLLIQVAGFHRASPSTALDRHHYLVLYVYYITG
jgi:ABC-type thiamine transport system ATPase subunit